MKDVERAPRLVRVYVFIVQIIIFYLLTVVNINELHVESNAATENTNIFYYRKKEKQEKKLKENKMQLMKLLY